MESSPKQTCEDLLALVRHVKSALNTVAERHGLTHMQLYAMHCIDNGDVAMGKVASSLHCDASNITGIIDRLVAQGLVSRHENESDRRAKLVHLTEKGKQVIQAIGDELVTVVGANKLNVWERSALHELISRIV